MVKNQIAEKERAKSKVQDTGQDKRYKECVRACTRGQGQGLNTLWNKTQAKEIVTIILAGNQNLEILKPVERK